MFQNSFECRLTFEYAELFKIFELYPNLIILNSLMYKCIRVHVPPAPPKTISGKLNIAQQL